MSGWVFLVVFVALAFGALWRLWCMPRVVLELAGAALMIGAAGYAWQGRPMLVAVPAVSAQSDFNPDQAVAVRRAMSGRFGGTPQLLDTADALIRAQEPAAAVGLLNNALTQYPRNADLWIGLGNALVAHNQGLISPAALFAFDKAASLAPDQPAPAFFKGLALAQSGRLDEAQKIWENLLARTPSDAPWRANLTTQIEAISRMRRP